MRWIGPRRTAVATLTAVVLVMGGVTAVTPAGAQVAEYAATNWKKIWKKQLQPLADKRYYTRTQSDAKYQPKGSYETAGSGYTRAESDAKYAGAGSSYTKAETDANYYRKTDVYTKAQSDAKYAPFPTVYRGTWALSAVDDAHVGFTQISYPQLSAPPIVHFVDSGAAPPAGCSGNVQAPNAQAGHLCIFEGFSFNMDNPNVMGPEFGTDMGTFGGTIWDFATSGVNHGYALGTFAVRPIALAAPGVAPAAPPANSVAPPD